MSDPNEGEEGAGEEPLPAEGETVPEDPAPAEAAPDEPAPDEPAPDEPAPDEPAPEEEPPPPAAVEEEVPKPVEEPPPTDEVEEVQVADHMPSTTPSEKTGQVRRESTVSYIPLTESSVLNQLKDADQQARNTMTLINSMKRVIGEYQDKPHMTEEDTRILEEKQVELLKTLSEFEAITRKMQKLVGLSGSSLTQVKPSEVAESKPGVVPKEGEPPEGAGGIGDKSVQTREADFYPPPEDMLPQVVVCGFANQIPRILICETGNKSKPKPKSKCQKNKQHKNRPQMMCPPPPSPTGQAPQCYCVEEQLRAKDNTIQCLKKKMAALQSDMQSAMEQNCNLNAQLEKANKKQTERAICPSACVPQCVANYTSQPTPQPKAICPSACVPQCVANYISQPTTICPPQCVVNDSIDMAQNAMCPSKCPPTCAANASLDTTNAQPCRPNLNAECLKTQLNIIELEVQKMRDDLVEAQKEQQKLDDQRDLLKCAAPKCLSINYDNALSPCACSAPPQCKPTPKCLPISNDNAISPCVCSPPPQYTGCRPLPQQ